jgi:hypothetical protein
MTFSAICFFIKFLHFNLKEGSPLGPKRTLYRHLRNSRIKRWKQKLANLLSKKEHPIDAGGVLALL